MGTTPYLVHTCTITMIEGPVTEVPTTIALLGDSAASILFNPSKTNNHFADTAIHGTRNLVCVDRVSAVLGVSIKKEFEG